jgi:hypothetical protein
MKRLTKWALFLAVPLLLVLSLSAGAGIAPAAKAKPVKPRTLVTAKGLIHGFAQDGKAIAWLAGPFQHPWSVYVRGPNARKTWVVGKADESAYEIPGRVITLPMALAGTRALWTTFTGGAGWVYTDVATGAPGMRQVFVNEYQIWSPGPNESPVPGVGGDGATLAYGAVLEDCPTLTPIPRDCPELYSRPGSGVVVVAHAYNPPAIGGIPPPVMLALSQGRVAVVPAASPRPNDGYGPRPVANGPVGVYDLSGRLLSTVHPIGTVRDVALAWPTLSVIVERSDGTKALERYDARASKGTFLAPARRISAAATDLAASEVGTVFRVGSRIYFRHDRLRFNSEIPRSICQANSTPIGLSVEGHRIAWAVNVKGHGRVVALTLG